ncbi:MAG: methylamine dehydrogenase light chain [Halioglobus sp.]
MQNWFDKAFEKSSGTLADRTSRRGFLGRLGAVLVGGMLIPLLPVMRYSEAEAADSEVSESDWDDPKSCGYWAYCATDGWLCSCCGGTSANCPPGTQPSPISWVGTCRNPGDGKNYVVSYNDCCGTAGCQRCYCNRNEGDTPKYRPQKSNSVTWCYGGVAPTYNCTVSRVMALAE